MAFSQDTLKTAKYTLHFGFDKTFPPSEMAKLRAIADTLKAANDSMVLVEGHSDATGPKKYNMELSVKRANQVREWLVKNNAIHKDSIKAVGYGETKPAFDNKKAKTRSMNRRAEVIVTFKSMRKKKAIVLPPTPFGDLFGNIKKKKGTNYCIDTQRDTTITTPDGHLVKIPALAFRLPNGNIPEGCVNLDILELLNKADMFAHRVTSASNGNLAESINAVRLETGGVSLVKNITFVISENSDNIKTDASALKGDKKGEVVGWSTNTGSSVAVVTDEQVAGYCDCVYKNFAYNASTKSVKEARCPFFFCKIGNAFKKKYKANPEYSKEAVRSKYAKPDTDNCKEAFPNVPDELSDKILSFADFGSLDTTLMLRRRELNKVADRRSKDAKKSFSAMTKEAKTNNLTDIYRAEAVRQIDESNARMNQALAENKGKSFYVWSIAELGWQDLQAPLAGTGAKVRVNLTPGIDKECLLFVNGERALSNFTAQADHYISPSIGTGNKLTLVVIQNVQGVPHYFTQDINLNGDLTIEPILKEGSVTALETLISTLR